MVGICGHKDVSLYASSQGWVRWCCLDQLQTPDRRVRLSHKNASKELLGAFKTI